MEKECKDPCAASCPFTKHFRISRFLDQVAKAGYSEEKPKTRALVNTPKGNAETETGE